MPGSIRLHTLQKETSLKSEFSHISTKFKPISQFCILGFSGFRCLQLQSQIVLFTSKIYEKFEHPIAITMDQPTSVQSIPFPAVTVLKPFRRNPVFLRDTFLFSFAHDPFKQLLFRFLKFNDAFDQFFAQIIVCNLVSYFCDYPHEFNGNMMITALRNYSSLRNFAQQKALWNSKYETRRR